MRKHGNFIQESRKVYRPEEERPCTLDELKVGSLQRIAHSLEAIEKPKRLLLISNEELTERNAVLDKENRELRQTNGRLKAVITRMKNKYEK